MALAVILNDVSAAHDFLCEIRVAQHTIADAKKSGARPVALELSQHLRRDVRIGSIVDGDRDIRRSALCQAAVAGKTNPIGPQQLTSRPESRGRQCRMIGDESAQRPRPGARTRQPRRRRAQVHGTPKPPTAAPASSGPARARACSCEMRIQKILPESGPSAPLMAAGNDVHRACRERRGQQIVRPGKAVVLSVAQKQRPRIDSRFDIAPYSAFRIGFRKFARLPGGEPRSSDLIDQHAVSQVGCKQAQSIDLIQVRAGIVQRDQAAQRNSRQPDRRA